MTKLMLIFKTVEAAFLISLIADAADHFSDGWDSTRVWLVVWVIFELWMTTWMYQALLDLYLLLRNPNQGKLAGHMPVPDFLQFTEAVTCAMMEQQDTAPRPLFAEESDDECNEQIHGANMAKASEMPTMQNPLSNVTH